MKKILRKSDGSLLAPVFPDALVLDSVPQLGSYNAVTSDGVARAVAGASGEVPAVAEGDNGKVLGAVYDAGGPGVEWVDPPATITVDQAYDATSANAQSGVAVAGALATVNQVPASTSVDENKVLTVNAQGVAGWANQQTELPTVTGNSGKVLAVNSGATGVEWVNHVPIEVVASLPASPTAGVLYIVTGA